MSAYAFPYALAETSLKAVKAASHYPGGILKRSFVSTVRPTVHNNPSQKRHFPKTVFNPKLKNTMQLVVFMTFLKSEFSRNHDVTIIT